MDQSLVSQEELPEMRNIVDDGIVWWVVVDFISIWTEYADPANYWRIKSTAAKTSLLE